MILILRCVYQCQSAAKNDATTAWASREELLAMCTWLGVTEVPVSEAAGVRAACHCAQRGLGAAAANAVASFSA